MKVKELIEKLQKFNPEMEVRRHDCVSGDEEINDLLTGKDYTSIFAAEYENIVVLR